MLADQAIVLNVMPSFESRIETALVAGVETVTFATLVQGVPPLISMVPGTGGSAAAAPTIGTKEQARVATRLNVIRTRARRMHAPPFE